MNGSALNPSPTTTRTFAVTNDPPADEVRFCKSARRTPDGGMCGVIDHSRLRLHTACAASALEWLSCAAAASA